MVDACCISLKTNYSGSVNKRPRSLEVRDKLWRQLCPAKDAPLDDDDDDDGQVGERSD